MNENTEAVNPTDDALRRVVLDMMTRERARRALWSNLELSIYERMVMAWLIDRARAMEPGGDVVRMPQIIRELGSCWRTVRKALDGLAARQLLTISPGEGRHHRYTIHAQKLVDLNHTGA